MDENNYWFSYRSIELHKVLRISAISLRAKLHFYSLDDRRSFRDPFLNPRRFLGIP